MKCKRERYLVVRFQVTVMDNIYLYLSLDVHPKSILELFLLGNKYVTHTCIIYKHNKLSDIFL